MTNKNGSGTTTTNYISGNTSNFNMDSTPDGMMNQMKLSSTALVAEQFPINSLQQLTLQSNEIVTGRVYCTDEATRTVVLQKALTYTTLSSDIRIISVNSIIQSKLLVDKVKGGGLNGKVTDTNDEDEDVVVARSTPLTQPLPQIQKKVLEERERRAIRLAEESLRHINPKASPIGQAVFERLLKACGEVYWKNDTTSILVLNQIQVDAPYEPQNCSIATTSNNGRGGTTVSNKSYHRNNSSGALEDGSLDRVKKIVASALGGSDAIKINATIAGSKDS